MSTATPSPPAVPILPIQNLIGIWSHRTELLLGHLHAIHGTPTGKLFDYAAIKIADSSHAFDPGPIPQLVHDAASINLPLVAWAYVYPDNPAAEAAAIIKVIPAGVRDVVLDAEIEWEDYAKAHGGQATAAAIKALCAPLVAAGLRLHLSTFWSPALHPSFPWRAFMQYCHALMPQCYLEPGGTRTPGSILSGSLSECRQYVAVTSGQSIVPTVNQTAFLPKLKALGIHGFNVYAWDDDGDAEVESHFTAWAAAVKAFRV